MKSFIKYANTYKSQVYWINVWQKKNTHMVKNSVVTPILNPCSCSPVTHLCGLCVTFLCDQVRRWHSQIYIHPTYHTRTHASSALKIQEQNYNLVFINMYFNLTGGLIGVHFNYFIYFCSSSLISLYNTASHLIRLSHVLVVKS